METKDDAMLREVWRVLGIFFRAKITPPSSMQLEPYHQYEGLFFGKVDERRLAAFVFQAELIRCLGVEFMANPPVDDPDAKFLFRTFIDFCQGIDFGEHVAYAYLLDPGVTQYAFIYTAIVEAATEFYFADNSGPFSEDEMAELRDFVTNRVETLSQFFYKIGPQQPPEKATTTKSLQMSLVVIDPLQCLIPWIAKGNRHKQEE